MNLPVDRSLPDTFADPAHAAQAAALDAVVQWFEHLTPESVRNLSKYYAADARFKDPFNEVTGPPAIEAIFTHMFETLIAPRFVVTGRVAQGAQCFLFDAECKVRLHRDYWDAAEELYEKLPLVGSLMRWLKRRANS